MQMTNMLQLKCKYTVKMHRLTTLANSPRSSSASSSVRPGGGAGLAGFPMAPPTGTSDRLSAGSLATPLLGEFKLISAGTPGRRREEEIRMLTMTAAADRKHNSHDAAKHFGKENQAQTLTRSPLISPQ